MFEKIIMYYSFLEKKALSQIKEYLNCLCHQVFLEKG